MPKKTRITTDQTTSTQLNNRTGRILRTMREARPDLGELPICYITNRDERVGAITPPWLAEWAEANPDLVMDSIALWRAENTTP